MWIPQHGTTELNLAHGFWLKEQEGLEAGNEHLIIIVCYHFTLTFYKFDRKFQSKVSH